MTGNQARIARAEMCPECHGKGWVPMLKSFAGDAMIPCDCHKCDCTGKIVTITDESLDGWIRRDRVLELIDAELELLRHRPDSEFQYDHAVISTCASLQAAIEKETNP